MARCVVARSHPSDISILSGAGFSARRIIVCKETRMDRAGKSESIEMLKGVFADAGAVVVTHYTGLTVAEMTDLRHRLRAKGASLKVVKNRLAQKALNGSSDGAQALFKGPVAIAYGPDAVSAAKVSTEYAKANEKFSIIGGMMGEQILDAGAIDALAKLPSLDELRGKLLGLLNAPATRIAGVLQAPAGQLARVFNAYATKDAA
jgi:large subunit ribosomal protein L10